ncbi:CRP-like cAMP-binding protein [Nocardioides massiliensis]|uniref:CRP-like cAMP-binding protein n=1 Tax=Nocardioides massiliensis TaxID=1325935 RepID=A0ABT9NLF3_9ACTN|nr:CRP-like cAMP-binding protein [Nocardioides massiliensis]
MLRRSDPHAPATEKQVREASTLLGSLAVKGRLHHLGWTTRTYVSTSLTTTHHVNSARLAELTQEEASHLIKRLRKLNKRYR